MKVKTKIKFLDTPDFKLNSYKLKRLQIVEFLVTITKRETEQLENSLFHEKLLMSIIFLKIFRIVSNVQEIKCYEV